MTWRLSNDLGLLRLCGGEGSVSVETALVASIKDFFLRLPPTHPVGSRMDPAGSNLESGHTHRWSSESRTGLRSQQSTRVSDHFFHSHVTEKKQQDRRGQEDLGDGGQSAKHSGADWHATKSMSGARRKLSSPVRVLSILFWSVSYFVNR